LLLSFTAFAQDDDDTTDVVKVTDSFSQVRFGIDIAKPIMYSFNSDRKSIELEADYYWKKEMYLSADAGWGSSKLNDTALSFSTSNIFFKAGLNKSMLNRVLPNDFDMAFIGFRYGIAFIDRGEAFFRTRDAFWGETTGIIPGTNMTAHWAEVVAGTKLEIFKGIFVGWTVKGKFLLNKTTFRELPPAHIAGYGAGDKNSIFDFNFYLSYAIRWRRDLKVPVVNAAASK
jgi:hypothetical protein